MKFTSFKSLPTAYWLATILIMSLLVGCGGQPAAPAPTEAPPAAETEAVAETESPTEEAPATTETLPAETEEPLPEDEIVEPAGPETEAECVVAEIPDNALIAPVSEQEWRKGSADAPITLIEYGDFQ